MILENNSLFFAALFVLEANMVSDKTVFFVAPYGIKAGGCESLHQAASELIKAGICVRMAYVGYDEKNINPYRHYDLDFLTLDSVSDSESNILVFPELYRHLSVSFFRATVFVWWLSLPAGIRRGSNIIKRLYWVLSLPLKILLRRHGYTSKSERRTSGFLALTNEHERHFKYDSRITHLCSSLYAWRYVRPRACHHSRIVLSPVSDYYVNRCNEFQQITKEDIVLYNYEKSGDIIPLIKPFFPNMTFFALKGFSEAQLLLLFSRAKIYLDLGPFPGPERMPKEAALCGCAIITGTRGAAGNNYDVPIPDEFKIDSSLPIKQQAILLAKIFDLVLQNYPAICRRFDPYRIKTMNLKKSMTLMWLDVLKSV